MYIQGHHGDYFKIHEKHLEQLLPELESSQPHLSEPPLLDASKGVPPAFHRAVSLCPPNPVCSILCSNTVITVSWRHRLVCIWPVFTKALWSVWLYFPFLMWNDASRELIWGTGRHTSWRMWGTHSLEALLLSDGKYTVCVFEFCS